MLLCSQKMPDLVGTCGIIKFTPRAQTSSSVPHVASQLPHALLGSINASPRIVTFGPVPAKPPHANLNLGITSQISSQAGSHEFLWLHLFPKYHSQAFFWAKPVE